MRRQRRRKCFSVKVACFGALFHPESGMGREVLAGPVMYWKGHVLYQFLQVREKNFSLGILFKIKLQILITKPGFSAPVHASETFVNLPDASPLHVAFCARCRCELTLQVQACVKATSCVASRYCIAGSPRQDPCVLEALFAFCFFTKQKREATLKSLQHEGYDPRYKKTPFSILFTCFFF